MEKVLVKADKKWVHFCYITPEMRTQFDEIRGQHSVDSVIARWALDDFNVTIETMEDIQVLKEQILDFYEEKYPFLFIEARKLIDRLGLTRLWIQENLYKELRKWRSNPRLPKKS